MTRRVEREGAAGKVLGNFFLLPRGEAVLTKVAGLVEGCCGKVGQDRPYVHQALCEVRGALTRATTWNFLSDDQTSCMIVPPPP